MLETAHDKLKDLNRRNNEIAKRKFVEFEATITKLREQIATLTTERDTLKTQLENQPTNVVSPREQELTEQIITLSAEKVGLEKSLAEERAKISFAPAPTPAPADASPEQAALIVSPLLQDTDIFPALTRGTGEPYERT